MSVRQSTSSRNLPPEFILDACKVINTHDGKQITPEALRLLRSGEADTEELQQVLSLST